MIPGKMKAGRVAGPHQLYSEKIHAESDNLESTAESFYKVSQRGGKIMGKTPQTKR